MKICRGLVITVSNQTCSMRKTQRPHRHLSWKPHAARGGHMKRIMIGSVIMIGAVVIWGFFAHTAWSQVDVISAILGQGITGFVPEFTDQHKIADSVIFQDTNGNVGISSTSPSPSKLLVNQTGNASASDSLLDGIHSDTTGNAIGVNSELDAIRGHTTGSPVGNGSELDAVTGRAEGDASGPDTQVAGVRGRVSGNATGQGASVVGVRGRSSGDATGTFSTTVGLSGTANGTPSGQGSSAIGVFGAAQATSGRAVGVQGSSRSPDGQGVLGLNFSPTGFGVMGQSPSRGVFGRAQNTSGDSIGVLGQSLSPVGAGVFGRNDATSGPAQGVTGISASPSGIGVLGQVTANSGTPAAVFGDTLNHPNGIAVFGSNPTGIAGRFDGSVQITCPTFPCVTINGFGFFDMAENLPLAARVTPGEVVVVTEGKAGYGIAPASHPYDTRVAGIVSANPPVLLQSRQREQSAPVAMVGVVKAKATAANGPIRVGDLLTTSGISGHLMRCPTALRCVGAVVGKALEPLAKGEKQVLVMLWRQ